MKKILLLAAAVLAIAATSVQAQDYQPVGFQTPSGNIHCQLDTYGSPELRCDMVKLDKIAPKSRDCGLDWGNAFAFGSYRAQGVCHGDTVIEESLPVLAYGSTWKKAGCTCTSEPSGLICSNAKHGFQLSRVSQRLW
jgi:hypothetical protein